MLEIGPAPPNSLPLSLSTALKWNYLNPTNTWKFTCCVALLNKHLEEGLVGKGGGSETKLYVAWLIQKKLAITAILSSSPS